MAIDIIEFGTIAEGPALDRLTMARPLRFPNVVQTRTERPQVQDIVEKLREARDRISDLMVRL